MNRLIILGLFLGTTGFAEATELKKDLDAVKEDLVKTEQDFEKLLYDAGKCISNNIPSVGTLTVDAIVDSCLRQYEPVANFIKQLEKKNPVNGAIVRDFSKAITVLVKMYLEVPVDQTGRLYDRSDFYAQAVKVTSKMLGFGALYVGGGIENGALLFLVNNGGDVLSQGVLDSGTKWRKNQTASFEEFLLETYSITNSMVSIPAKGTVSYAIGAGMNAVSLIDAVELAVLVMLNQVTFIKGNPSNVAQWNNKVPFLPGFMVTFVTSVVKSLFLTTLCKSAVAGVNGVLDTYVWGTPVATTSEKREL